MTGIPAMSARQAEAPLESLSIAQQRRLLASLLEQRRAALPRAFPASFQQEGLWFLHQLEPGSAAYNVPIALRAAGRLRRDALARSLRELVRRHWTLRSSFALTAGGLVQVLSPASALSVPLPVQDLSHLPRAPRDRELRRRIGEAAQRPFDLARAPLLRAALLPLAAGEQVVCLVVHHTMFDGWSMGVLVQELTALYRAYSQGAPSPLPELPLQYVDFAQWQRERVGKGALDDQLAHWRERLRSLPGAVELPADRPRPAHWSFRGGASPLELPAGLCAALARLGREAGASMFMTLLAGLAALLCRWSHQEDLAIGTPLAGRNRSELEGLIGFFANTLVMRVAAPGTAAFGGLLVAVRQVALAAYANQDLPFEKLVAELRPERDLSRSPLFQVMFSLHNAPLPPIALPGVTFHVLEPERATARFDLLFELWETPLGLRGLIEYSSDLFAPATPARLGRLFQALLAGIAAEPQRPLAELPLLAASERHQLVAEWNDTAADFFRGAAVPCLHDLFAAQAARSPEALAVRCAAPVGEPDAAGGLTYRQLDEASNRLAHWLRARGVGPEVVAGVLLERSLELMVALLGVLKAGGAYLPLDPSYPPERLGFFVADAAPVVVLSVSGLAGRVPAGPPVVLLDADWPEIARASAAPPVPAAGPDNLAYVIYTSGSTGRPKGAMNAHRGIVNRILWMQAAYGLGPGDRVLQKTPASFDVSVWEFFWPLAVGARLVMAMPDGHRDPAYLAAAIAREGITTLHFVPSMLRVFLDAADLARCACVRRVMASGEELPAELVAGFHQRFGGAELHNLYGPTEAAVDVTAWACPPGPAAARVPIGRPIGNLRIHLLEAGGQPVPIGVPGELHIGGAGVGRGYLARPELTAARFVPDAFSPQPGARLYRSGDLARQRPEGVVEFLGRVDHQVKIRGHRIELGEIEHALRSCAGVRDAVVAVRGAGHEQQLVAYLVTGGGPAELPVAHLRQQLRERLPEAMVPAAWVAMPALPLLANGKVDRKALPEPTAAARTAALVPPRSYLEELVAGTWMEVLGTPELSVGENLFDLGAHSLLATQVASRLNRELGIELPLRRLFELPTVALQAAAIQELRNAATRCQPPPIRPVPRDRWLPLSFSQQRLWFFDRWAPGSAVFNVPTALGLDGELAVAALAASLDLVVRRHEVLRSRFLDVGGEPAQVIDPPRPRPAALVDLAALPAAQLRTELARVERQEARRPFDLERGPLLRNLLLRLDRRAHVALLTMHHIAADGWSLRILTAELGQAYRALCAGRPPALPELPIQFADYAAWQRQWLQGEVLARELAFWREQLAGAPAATDLPLDRPRGQAQRFRGRRRAIAFPPDLGAALRALAREAKGTLFMVLVAAVAALLRRYSRQPDLVIGTLIANRHRREVENLIGFFVNALALRTRLTEEMSWRQAIARVREITLDVYAHQELPFEKLVEELNPERRLGLTPLFQVLVVLQNTPAAVLELPGLRLAAREVERDTVNHDLYFTLAEEGDGIRCHLDYDADLFAEATIQRLLVHFAAMVRAMAAAPDRRALAVPLLSEAERQQLLREWAEWAGREDAAGRAERRQGLDAWLGPLATAAPAAEAARGGGGGAAPTPPASGPAAFAPPRTRTERQLAEIWREVLGREEIGLDDSFFDLGGHSLLATRVLSRLRAALGVDLPVRALFETMTLRALAARVEAAAGSAFDLVSLPILPTPAGPAGQALPLSFGQERLWFLDQLEPGSPAYNLPAAMLIEGRAAAAVFAAALNAIVRRHAALRTTFGAAAGNPVQVVHADLPVALPVVDLAALPAAARATVTLRLAREEARLPFDLGRGPLLRARLLRRGPVEHVLLFDMHHIIADAWSMGVFVSEVAALYPALAAGQPPRLPVLPVQYPDFACWQRETLAGEPLERQLGFWKRQLAAPPGALDLPGRGARPAAAVSWRGGTRRCRLPEALCASLKAVSRQRGTTLFMTLAAGFAGLLHRYSGATDLMIGVPVAGRGRPEIEPLIGFFVNTLVLRVDAAGRPSGLELMQRVRRATLDAFAHQDVPFERLVAELNPERNLDTSPLFQVMFVLQNAPLQAIELPGLRLRRLDVETGTTRFELFLELTEDGLALAGAVHYRSDLFERPFITRLLAHFEILLEAMAADPARAVAELPLLSPAERAQLLWEWNDTAGELPAPARSPAGALCQQLVARLAARHPDRIAVRAGGRQLSHAELDRRANGVARQLGDRALSRPAAEGLVALLAPRGSDFLAALLGVWKAGAAYLPLDPHHPAGRLREVLRRSRCSLVLAAPALRPLLAAACDGLGGEPPGVLELDGRRAAEAVAPAWPRGGDRGLAYVIFTSGSTGTPKGAMVEHRGMVNHLFAKVQDLELAASDRVAQTATQCFDISVWQFLAPLLAGGSVEVYDDETVRDPAALLDRVEADGVTVLQTVPSLLRLMLEEIRRRGDSRPPLSGLRWLVATGEALPPELCREWSEAYPGTALLNAYGPTECSDDVSHYRVPAASEERLRGVPIGRPVLNTRLFLLDTGLMPVPAGAVGELCVGGTGVGRGYLFDPATTAAAFVPDPCSGDAGERLYRSGDLARCSDEGNLEFLGRIDHQVKVRGFRLELGEIEALLGEHPALAAAAVAATPEASGTPGTLRPLRLVAYVVPRCAPAPGVEELRDFLRARLPEYAVPAAWVTLERLPLTPNGKLDRRALPDPGTARLHEEGREHVAPRGEVEATVAAIFASVIGLERVGVLDDFFALGGHSLLATQAIWRLRESFGVELPLRALFEAPTAAELAEVVEERIIEQIEGLEDDEVDSFLAARAERGTSPPPPL